MKKFTYLIFTFVTCLSCSLSADSAPQYNTRIGIVNTKKCLESSKLGKQEQANFEKMKAQMESVLAEKEKGLEDIENKLNDEDYLDSISSDAEAELKRKRRTIRQEAMQLQNQYMQTLQQANYKIIQELTESVAAASEVVAKNGYDVIINDEALSFYNKQLDVSEPIIKQMDLQFDKQVKEARTSK
jgi:outer membrane protein